ncbi:MAG: FkbH-like protein [Kiritimatiellia bacterium]|jgi:FkbH-like protein
MREFEIRSGKASPAELPKAILHAFTRRGVKAASMLAWGEHCVECAMPDCFKSCDLYEARSDGKCRRFQNGMEKVAVPDSDTGFITRITFKPWGQLWSPGSTHTFQSANTWEAGYRALAAGVRAIPPAIGIGKVRPARGFYQVCKSFTRWSNRHQALAAAECFFIQLYNPEESPIDFTLTFGHEDPTSAPWQEGYSISPGYHEIAIPLARIQATLDTDRDFAISFTPNIEEAPRTIYLGWMEFVSFDQPYAGQPIKCLVWDLDHTLWDGVLMESDADQLTLKPGIREVLEQLDQRGILHSIASKNDLAAAMPVLERLGVADFFLHPEIHWEPKSLSLQRIREKLNIGMDAIAFIDDSPFEMAEVRQALPEVLVLDALNANQVPWYPGFAGSETEESRNRRAMYQSEALRKDHLSTAHASDFEAFLKSADLQLTILRPMPENLDRVNDLVQRANQMNYSGHRHTRPEVEAMLNNPALDLYLLDARDAFGSYGKVGFCIVDRATARMTDLIFSCRIQMKRVDRAFLCWMLNRYATLDVLYRPTERNPQCRELLEELGFTQEIVEGEIETYRFDGSKAVPTEDLVTITDETGAPA